MRADFFSIRLNIVSDLSSDLRAGRSKFRLQIGITGIELQSPIVSARGVSGPSGIHEAITDAGEPKSAGQSFPISGRGKVDAAFVNLVGIFITLQSQIRPAENVV